MSFAYFPLYTGDYIRDTRHLSPMKHGVYLLALMHCWDSKGPMPLDEQECAGVCNCRSADEVEALRYVLNRFFVKMVDGHYNRRIALELERSEAISSARSAAGRIGAQAKAKHLLSKSQAKAKQVPLSPSPSPSLSQTPPSSPIQATGELPLYPPTPAASSGEPARKRAVKPAAVSTDVWNSYSQAYRERYGELPVRNAKVNSLLSQLVSRLGSDEAPAVARFYLSHQGQLYVRSMHAPDLMIRDCEKLRTEWATNRQVTETHARQTDRTQTNANVFGRLIAKAEEENPDGKR